MYIYIFYSVISTEQARAECLANQKEILLRIEDGMGVRGATDTASCNSAFDTMKDEADLESMKKEWLENIVALKQMVSSSRFSRRRYILCNKFSSHSKLV